MKYTEYGLLISLDELKEILNEAKRQEKYNNKEGCIYIKGGEKPKIIQYSVYAECNEYNHTYNVREG